MIIMKAGEGGLPEPRFFIVTIKGFFMLGELDNQ